MKILFGKRILILCLTIATFIFTGCNESTVDSGNRADSETGENFTFYKSKAMAEETVENRSEEISDPFEINNVTLDDKNGKKLMHIEVTQALGCKENYQEKFGVIWNGIMLMIYPPQVGFYLTFNADGCSELDENVKETVTLDLYEIFDDREFVNEVAKFTVINASKFSPDNDYEVRR